MLEIQVTIVAPDLAGAINNLAAAIGGAKPQPAAAPAPQMPAAPTPMPAPAPAPTPTPTTAPLGVGVPLASAAATTGPAAPPFNAAPIPPAAAIPGPGPMPTQPPVQAPGVPLAAAPQYTVDQIMAAGATLMDAGKVNELMTLLHSFGVQAVMDLKPEQMGAFATALRELGAKI